MAFAANGLESIFEEGKQVYESLGTENKKTYSESSQNKYGYDFLSERMDSNALATISTGAFAYKSSASIFDEGRSIFSKLGTSDSINPYENFINGIRIDKYGDDVPYIKSETYISQATDEEVKEMERQQRAENPTVGSNGDGVLGKLADLWLMGPWKVMDKIRSWEEQNQAFMNFATIVPAILGGTQVAMEKEAASNYDTLYEEEQADIRERVLQNIEESKTARGASNYKPFAEFENGFKVGSKATDYGKYSTIIDDKVKVIDKVDLDGWICESFTDGNYRTVVTEQNITFYRTYGGGAKVNGSYVNTTPAGNRINAKINTALVPEWKNSRQYEAVIEVPKGTIINIGKVEKQYTKTGALLEWDGDQILLPQGWPSEWIKEIREVPSR
jgi:hypothetical protein